jgi:hypothetical protein
VIYKGISKILSQFQIKFTGSFQDLLIRTLCLSDELSVFSTIFVGEVKKLLGMGKQDVSIRGVTFLEYDGSCS